MRYHTKVIMIFYCCGIAFLSLAGFAAMTKQALMSRENRVAHSSQTTVSASPAGTVRAEEMDIFAVTPVQAKPAQNQKEMEAPLEISPPAYPVVATYEEMEDPSEKVMPTSISEIRSDIEFRLDEHPDAEPFTESFPEEKK